MVENSEWETNVNSREKVGGKIRNRATIMQVSSGAQLMGKFAPAFTDRITTFTNSPRTLHE